MKGLAITTRGLENTASIEISELISSKAEQRKGCIIFSIKDYKDLCLLCYKAQSVDRVLFLLDEFRFKDIFKEIEKKIDVDKWVKGKRFKIECERLGEHEFKSVDVVEKISKSIMQKFECSADFRNPDLILFFYIVDDHCYFGIDFSGFELNKRQYKIFLHSNSLRGTIGYSLLREAGFDAKQIILDPFSKDGVVCIEAALFCAQYPVNYYRKDKFLFLKLNLGIDAKFFDKIDKKIKKIKNKIYCYDSTFKHVDYCKKNAKIAGIDKEIDFSRTDLEWLDLKFKENSVDIIASNPPLLRGPLQDKIYNEFFYQSEYILKVNGVLAITTTIEDVVKKYAEKYNLKLIKDKSVWSGEQEMKILVFEKTTKSKIKNKLK